MQFQNQDNKSYKDEKGTLVISIKRTGTTSESPTDRGGRAKSLSNPRKVGPSLVSVGFLFHSPHTSLVVLAIIAIIPPLL